MKKHSGQFRDLTGKTFGLLTVLDLAYKKREGAYWLCRCVCGDERIRHCSNLKRTTGCARCAQKLVKPNRYAGYTKELSIWIKMKRRCTNPQDNRYHCYGARGISVCSEWLDDFWKFVRDLGKCPSGYSLERIDNNGNYCKENCAWIPRRLQAKNRTTNRFITIEGETKILRDWCELHSVSPCLFYYRTKTCGMTDQEALTTPKRKRKVL